MLHEQAIGGIFFGSGKDQKSMLIFFQASAGACAICLSICS
jgi:hypothetical protein